MLFWLKLKAVGQVFARKIVWVDPTAATTPVNERNVIHDSMNWTAFMPWDTVITTCNESRKKRNKKGGSLVTAKQNASIANRYWCMVTELPKRFPGLYLCFYNGFKGLPKSYKNSRFSHMLIKTLLVKD